MKKFKEKIPEIIEKRKRKNELLENPEYAPLKHIRVQQDTPIYLLPISNKLRTLLYSIDVNTVGRLRETPLEFFRKLYGAGKKSQEEFSIIQSLV